MSLTRWLLLLLVMGIGATAQAEQTEWGKYAVDGRRSGYTYAAPETRAMQAWGGRALALPFVDGYSTTALVKKIRA